MFDYDCHDDNACDGKHTEDKEPIWILMSQLHFLFFHRPALFLPKPETFWSEKEKVALNIHSTIKKKKTKHNNKSSITPESTVQYAE